MKNTAADKWRNSCPRELTGLNARGFEGCDQKMFYRDIIILEAPLHAHGIFQCRSQGTASFRTLAIMHA